MMQTTKETIVRHLKGIIKALDGDEAKSERDRDEEFKLYIEGVLRKKWNGGSFHRMNFRETRKELDRSREQVLAGIAEKNGYGLSISFPVNNNCEVEFRK